MKSAANKLWNYFNNALKEKIIDEKDLIKLLKKFGIYLILNEYISKYSNTSEIVFKYSLNCQNIKNTFFEEELKILINLSNKKNILMIPLKGIVLAKQIYFPPELRSSGDLDVLVSYEQFEEFLEICKSLGYKFLSGKDINKSYIKRYLNNKQREHHFMMIARTVKRETNEFMICLEVHVDIILRSIFNISYQNKEFDAELYKHIEDINIENIGEVKVLNTYDNIIFLLLHFTKHYFRDIIIGFLTGNLNTQCKINLLHDVVLLIYMNYESFNWILLLKRAKKMNMINEILFPLHLIGDIYDIKDIDYIIKNNLKNINNTSSFIDKMCFIMARINTRDILFGNHHKLICDIINQYGNKRIKYNCYPDITSFNPLKIVNKCKEINGEVRIWWDNHILYFEIRVKKKKVMFLNKPRLNSKQDCIEIMFDTENRERNKPFVKNIIIKPRVKEGCLKMNIWEYLNPNLPHGKWKEEEIDNRVKYLEDGYLVNIGIHEKIINKKLKENVNISFDISIISYSNNNMDRISLTNKNSMWHIPCEYAQIVLCKK